VCRAGGSTSWFKQCDRADRPLVGDWPDLWLDATYLKQVKAGGSSQAANTDGKRAIVGLHIG